jgi:histidine triad (HIT) family protein
MKSAPDNDPSDCPFCNIACGRDSAADVVCEGEDWIAFFPLNPATPGHTLVIPREHVSDLWKVETPSLAGELMAAAIRVGRAIDTALRPEGMNLITSAGETAEQTVFHLHLHIVPRWRRDGFGQIWPVEGRFDDASLGDVATAIRNACSKAY